MPFLDDLAREAETRHQRIRARMTCRSPVAPMPPGWRAEDITGSADLDGYMPLNDAAEQLGVSTNTVLRQVNAGQLDAQLVGTTIYVRPAIVTVLHVRHTAR